MDITILFKACVKTIKTTNKTIGNLENKTNNLKISRDANLSKAKEIVKQVKKMQDFLNENKMAYLNVLNYLSTNKTMTEMDRLEIDSMAQQIINTCTSSLNYYRQDIKKQNISKQKYEHYNCVIDSVEKYLKTVSKVYTEAKAKRVKKVIETHKLSKLETKPARNSNLLENNNQETNKLTISKDSKKEIILLPQPVIENAENNLSVEELQMFESENDYMFAELNSLSDEVKQIENKVVHISELQELFTEKVLQQERDIERIATTVSTSTDNMKDANEQIRQAIQRNAGLRVWVLFFLLVMSFSLLFLDWYND